MNRKIAKSVALSLPLFLFAAASCGVDDDPGASVGATGGGSGGSGPAPTGGKGGGAGTTTGPAGGMAGTTAGGVSAGGMAGTTAGGAGGTSAGGAIGDPVTDFAGMKNNFGFAFKDSFYLTACQETQAHDCLTVVGGCPDPGGDFEEKGSLFKEEFKMGGELGKTYNVTIAVNGIVEGKLYDEGVRQRGADFSDLENVKGTDAWHVGGKPKETSYNVYKLSVFMPDGTTKVQHYYLNSYPAGASPESHKTMPIGYTATFEVPGQGVIKYLTQDSNCRAINNCGPGDNGAACPAARNVPNEPGLVVPTTFGGKAVTEINKINGAAQPFHAQMIHVTVTKVELKP